MMDPAGIPEFTPPNGIVPSVVLLGVGLIVWAIGGRVLRFGLALLGLGAGIAIGWALVVPLQNALALETVPWAVVAVGALMLAALAALAQRLAVAVAMAIILAVGLPLGVVTLDNATGILSRQELPTPALEDARDILGAEDTGFGPPPIPTLPGPLANELGLSEETLDSVEDVRQRAADYWSLAREHWDDLAPELRPWIIISVVIGLVAGLFCGVFVPKFSTATVTAIAGALLWLTAGRALLISLGDPVPSLTNAPAEWRLVVWTLISLIGLAIQWKYRAGRTVKVVEA